MRTTQIIPMLLAAVVATATSAAADVRFSSFDLHGGVNRPSGWDGGTTFGVSANLIELKRGLWIAPALFRSTMDRPGGDGILGIDLDQTVLSLGAELRWYPSRQQSGLYFGGGVFLNRIDQDSTFRVGTVSDTLSTSSESIGAMGLAGLRLGRPDGAAFLLEARYALLSGGNTLHLLGGVSFGR
jgi:hypothetical protein